MTAFRKYAIASAEVFNVANGDPIITDRGFSHLDILKRKQSQGTISCFNNGAPKCEFIQDLGLTLRPYINPVDMRLSLHPGTPSGSWDEIRSVGGTKNVYHLRYSDTLGTAWTLPGNYNLSANPVFAVSLIIPETRSSWDYTNNEPYIRIEFGNGQWSVLLSKQYGSFLQRSIDGTWITVRDISEGDNRIARALTDEKWIIIRCEFGGILISTNLGFTWEAYFNDDGSSIFVPAGPWRITGQGSAPIIGLGEYQPVTADYLGAPWDTFDVRSPLASAIITGRYILPAAGGSVGFIDASLPSLRTAQYRAVLNPVQTQAFPFRMWNSPLLQNVVLRYPFQRVTTSNTVTTPWDNWIVVVDVKKPYKLSDSSCTITLKLRYGIDSFDITGLRDRKVRVKLGYKMSDDTDEWATVFTGYINDIRITEENFGSTMVYIELVNIAALLKARPWNPLNAGAFAGMTPQAVGDFILKSEGFMDEAGLDTTYRAWFTTTLGTQPLPAGEWDHPFETIKPQESKFTTLERVFDYYGFEIAVDNDGVLVSLPKNYVNNANPWTLYRSDAAMLDDIRKQITSLTQHYNYRESITAAMVYAKLDTGQMAIMYTIDDPAETDTSLERFTPFRNWILEELSEAHGSPDVGIMLEKLNNISRDNLGLKKEPEISFPVHIGRSRRDLITINGCADLKIPDGTQFALMTHNISYKAETGLGEISSNCSLKMLLNQVTS